MEALDDPDMPDWQREELPKIRDVTGSADWLALPSKFDIHEHSIMERFCLDPDDGRQRETLLDAIHRKGAFCRFKDLVRRYDIEQHWYDYRDREVERIVAMATLESDEGIADLQRQLERTGLFKDLERAGVKAGDTVRIGDYELEWT